MSLPSRYRVAALNDLAGAGVWDPDGDLQALIDQHFGGNRMLDDPRLAAFQADVAERCARIPLGHILGTVRFGPLVLRVGSGTFIPRQQSLGLVRWVERNLELPEGATVYDLCAGVGAIGLALHQATRARVVCVEKDATAQSYLQRNIQRFGCQGAVSLLAADITRPEAFVADQGGVDVVVANPPYVPPEIELLPEWALHHPPGAIYAAEQGGQLIDASARLASRLLRRAGVLLIEHGQSQVEQVAALVRAHGFVDVRHCTDDEFSDATGPSVFTVGRKA